MSADIITCPKCGHNNSGDALECAMCGITFEIYAEVQEAASREKEPPKKKPAPPKEMALCPKCGHPNNPLSLDCLKCGIVFAKYFENMEIELEGDPQKEGELQKLRAAREAMEALRQRKEEEAKQEAIRKQQEEQERIEALKRERQEELKRQEALKRQQEEEERKRQEELRRQREKEEKERQETLRRQQEEEERQHQEELKKRQEQEERRAQEEIQRQQQEAQRLAQEEEEQRRQEKIRRQKEEEEQKRQEELAQQQAAEEAQKAALQQEHEAQEKAEAQRRERLAELMKPKGPLKKLLKQYSDQVIGMNYDAPTIYKPVRLASINDDNFSVLVEADELVYTYPMSSIVALIEGVDGVRTAAGREKAVYPLVIRVSHRVM